MRRWLAVTLILLHSGCLAYPDGTLVEIQHAVAPDSTCKYAVSNDVQPSGYFDPAVQPAGYQVVLLVRNNMEQRSDDPQEYGSVNVRNRVNDIEITGVEGCWYLFQGAVADFGSIKTPDPVDCKTLPVGQRGTIPANGEIDESGLDNALTAVTVLTPAHLQGIFGPTFSPTQIPPVGYTEVVNPANPSASQLIYSPALVDSTDPAALQPATRSAYWGANYPTSQIAPVVVQMRVVAALQSGQIVRSAWFVFPISVCPGCVADSCGDLVQQYCYGPLCSDNTPCTAGSCTNAAATCSVVQEYTGALPSYVSTSSVTVCLPAQGYTSPDCTTHTVGCPP